jgi:hypothetical protein
MHRAERPGRVSPLRPAHDRLHMRFGGRVCGGQVSSDGGRAVCLLSDGYDREGLNDPCTD